MTQRQALRRYPRLIAHLICESLGYFTPLSAANAIIAYIERKPFWCEWYCHMAGFRKEGTADERLVQIGKRTVEAAFKNRKSHSGYMAEYQHAIQLVKAELEQQGVTAQMLAAWF